jgi:hypothetical protein
MRKFYTLIALSLISGLMMAQVNVTLMVDITKYLAAGTPLGANGIRIGGDFGATSAMNGAVAMPAWSPSNAACALVDKGGNVWSITITFPSASIGMTQPFKFVNNDWGTNEGVAATSTVATDGCGVDDGAGNINRTLVIPASDIKLEYCWDACFKCNGSDPAATGVWNRQNAAELTITPNPVNTTATLRLNLRKTNELAVSIINLMGQEVIKINYGKLSAGDHNYDLDFSKIPSGIYLYRVSAGGHITSGNIVKL